MEIEPQPNVVVPPRPDREDIESDRMDRMRRDRRISIPFEMLLGRRVNRGGLANLAELFPNRLGIMLGRASSQLEAPEDELASRSDEDVVAPRRVAIRRFLDRDRDHEREIAQL